MRMEKLVEFNDKLLGLPSGVLAYFGCICIGYAIKASRRISNEWLPTASMIVGVVLFMWGAPTRNDDVGLRIWLFRNFCVGLAWGLLAWITHRSALKRLEKRYNWFGSSFDTDEFHKPKTPPL